MLVIDVRPSLHRVVRLGKRTITPLYLKISGFIRKYKYGPLVFFFLVVVFIIGTGSAIQEITHSARLVPTVISRNTFWSTSDNGVDKLAEMETKGGISSFNRENSIFISEKEILLSEELLPAVGSSTEGGTTAPDEHGAQSNPSERVVIVVEKSALLRFGSWAVSFLAVLVPIIALLGLLIFVIVYLWHRMKKYRDKLRRELGLVEYDLERIFNKLKADVEHEINGLKQLRVKRDLTAEETKVIERLEKSIDEAEKTLLKEIESIDGE